MLMLQLVKMLGAMKGGRKLQARDDVQVHQVLDEGHLPQVRDGGLRQIPNRNHDHDHDHVHDLNLNL